MKGYLHLEGLFTLERSRSVFFLSWISDDELSLSSLRTIHIYISNALMFHVVITLRNFECNYLILLIDYSTRHGHDFQFLG